MRRVMIPIVMLLMFFGVLSGSAPPAGAKGEFPSDWYYSGRRPALIAMEGKRAPALSVRNWIGEAQNMSKLKGKVVVVDVWATWCGPCMASIPHNVEMVKKHEKDGLVFIGVHEARRGTEKMAQVAKDKKINYPLAIDKDGKTVGAYNVAFFPSYYVIDRKGIIRAAGLQPGAVEKVVTKLLAEKADEKPAGKGDTTDKNEDGEKPAES